MLAFSICPFYNTTRLCDVIIDYHNTMKLPGRETSSEEDHFDVSNPTGRVLQYFYSKLYQYFRPETRVSGFTPKILNPVRLELESDITFQKVFNYVHKMSRYNTGDDGFLFNNGQEFVLYYLLTGKPVVEISDDELKTIKNLFPSLINEFFKTQVDKTRTGFPPFLVVLEWALNRIGVCGKKILSQLFYHGIFLKVAHHTSYYDFMNQ